jgi:hypothetical protein
MKLLNTSALLLTLVSLAFAGDQPTAALTLGKAPAKPTASAKLRQAESSAAATASNPIIETLATLVTIDPHSNAIFQAQSDFTGADKMGFSVTTLSDSNSKMTQVRFGVAWAAPGNWFVLTDMILGNSFYYYDHGGATVPVYAPILKIVVFNDGATPVTITQLSAYGVAR